MIGAPGNTGTFPTRSCRTQFLFTKSPKNMSCHSHFNSFEQICTWATSCEAAASLGYCPGRHLAVICNLLEPNT